MKLRTLRQVLLLFVTPGISSSSFASTTWEYDFGTGTGTFTSGVSTTFLPATETDGGTSRVRVGSGGGSFSLQSDGSSSQLVGVAPTSSSINKFSIYDFANAAATVTLTFDINLTGGASGTWYLFLGDGATFSDNNAFSGAQTFAGLRFQFGASDAITVSNRAGGSWATVSSTGIAQNTDLSVMLVGNNSSGVVTYGSESIAANSWDLWVNGQLVASDLAKAQLATGSLIDSFMFYGESSTANVAKIALDNISYTNAAVPEPSGAAILGSIGVLGLLRRRR